MATLSTPWSNYVYDLINRAVAPPALTDIYLRLFTGDPGDSGTPSNEVTGGSYTGQAITATMDAPTDGAGANTDSVVFPDMPACTVTHWAKCTSAAGSTASTVIEHDALDPAVVLAAGVSFIVPIGELATTVG